MTTKTRAKPEDQAAPAGVPDLALVDPTPGPPPEPAPPSMGPNDRILPDGRWVRLMRGAVYALEPMSDDDARSRRGGNLYGGVGQALPELDALGEPTGRSVRVTAIHEPEDAAGRHERITTGTGQRFASFPVHPPDPARDEIARLESLGLHATAAMIRQAEPPVERDPALEALGDVRWGYQQCQASGFDSGVVLAMLKAFAAGDWGVNGDAEAVELDDFQRSAAPAFGPEVRNAAALETGRGYVSGVYPFVRQRGKDGQLGAPRFVGAGDGSAGAHASVRIEHYPSLRSTIVYIA